MAGDAFIYTALRRVMTRAAILDRIHRHLAVGLGVVMTGYTGDGLVRIVGKQQRIRRRHLQRCVTEAGTHEYGPADSQALDKTNSDGFTLPRFPTGADDGGRGGADVRVTALAIRSFDDEIVCRMALHTVRNGRVGQATVKRSEREDVVVATRGPAGLHRLDCFRLGVRIMARRAHPFVRFVGREVDHGSHHVARQALVFCRAEGGSDRIEIRLGRRLPKRMARHAVDREVAHRAQLDLGVDVALRLTTSVVHRGELVNRGRVAGHAPETLQGGIVRLLMDPMPGGGRDVPPLVGVALYVTLRTHRVGHLSVRAQFLRLFHDLRERHLRASYEGRAMTGLAPQTSVLATREGLVWAFHQVAGEAEVVVVLDVVIRPIGVVPADGEGE